MGCNRHTRFDPGCVENSWNVVNATVLANADNYYTKRQVDDIIAGQLTPESFEEMIKNIVEEALTEDVATKSDLTRVEELVRKNAEDILDVKDSLAKDYLTKLQALDMFNAYAKVENETLTLNENILIIP